MNIARFSVSRPVAVTMRIAALVLLGWVCLQKLPVDLLPKVTIPTVAVSVNWPNTSPDQMETQIARPLEQAVSSVPGIYLVTSSSSLGSTSVRVQFNYGVDIDQATIDVMQAVQRAKRSFPNDPTLTEPSIFKFDPTTIPVLAYGISGDPNLVKLRTLITNEISPILESAGGVAAVNITGGQDRAIMVDVDPQKLEAFGLSIADVSRRIEAENLSLPAGIARENNTEYSIRSVGYFDNLEHLRRFPLGNFKGQLITLDQVATVRDASQEVRSFTRMQGEPAINLGVTKQSDANTIDTAKNVKEKIEEIRKRYPQLTFALAYDQSQFIEHSITDLKETAIIGAVLAILIITFFLRSLRSTFVIALSIPISVISSFALMYFCGFTLNTISLSGLALAVGLIVDDAIVVLENIHRHIERDKKSVIEAAVSGTQEIMSAVVASTFTVMIVFLPLLLIQGQAGQTFTQFALVVVFSIAISLLDAVTVVPMLASRVIDVEEVITEAHPELRKKTPGPMVRLFDQFGRWFHHFDEAYREKLNWAIHHRMIVVGGALLSILFAAVLWPFLGSEMLPETDSGDLSVRVKMPVGTAISKTNETMRKIEKILMDDPDVQTVIVGAGANVGVRGTRVTDSSDGSASLRLKANRATTSKDVMKRLQKKLGSAVIAKVQVSSFDAVSNIISGNQQGISVDVFGQNLEQLTSTAKMVMDALDKSVPGLENLDLSVQDTAPELQWKVDREKAQTLGISFEDIARTLSANTNGQLSSYYQENGFQYPIYVQAPESKRKSVEELKQLPVVGSETRGMPVLLGQVATPALGAGPNEISRNNRQRYISVTARLQDRTQSEVMTDITKTLETVKLPQGSYWKFGVQQLRQQEEFSGLGMAVLLAIALIYMLLASQFESFTQPLVVLTSVPLCAIGVVLALFLSGRPFGLTAFIGLLMLIGIVVKNGILLVDYTNQLRERGMPRDEAILTAGPTRLRPILMTTLAAILGMMPLALGIGSGSEMYAPLAIAVVGGLTTSSILTLFIVPTVYTYFDDLARWLRRDPQDLNRSVIGPVLPIAEEVKHV